MVLQSEKSLSLERQGQQIDSYWEGKKSKKKKHSIILKKLQVAKFVCNIKHKFINENANATLQLLKKAAFIISSCHFSTGKQQFYLFAFKE